MIQKNLLFALVIVILSLILSAVMDRLPQASVPIQIPASSEHLPVTGSSVRDVRSVPLDHAPIQAKLVVIALFFLALLISVAPLFIDQSGERLIYSSR